MNKIEFLIDLAVWNGGEITSFSALLGMYNSESKRFLRT